MLQDKNVKKNYSWFKTQYLQTLVITMYKKEDIKVIKEAF